MSDTEDTRCTIRCKMSQQKECECSCGGKNHGSMALVKQLDLFESLVRLPKKNPPFEQVPKKKHRQCAHCDRLVEWRGGYGMAHIGGTRTIMECPHCGWQGFQPAEPLTFDKDICPQCGSQGDLQDDHVAMPGKLVEA